MPLKKLLLRPGVNRENTRYTNEGGWYESDKVRFRQGTPEKIGGWLQISGNKFIGICRSLWNWATLAGQNLIGVGTTSKFYIENGGAYYDVTPIRTSTALGNNPFSVNGTTTTVTVTASSHGALTGDYVTFTGATAPFANTFNNQFVISYVDDNSYTITTPTILTPSGATGGANVIAIYQINVGSAVSAPIVGWGAGTWGTPPTVAPPSTVGTWGYGTTVTNYLIRIWNQLNWGQNLLFGPRGGPLYYWDAEIGYQTSQVSITYASPAVVTSVVNVVTGTPITLSTTGTLPTGLMPGKTYYAIASTGYSFNLSLTAGGAAINTTGAGSGTHYINPNGILLSSIANSDGYAPLYQNLMTISDASRFVLVFGTNDYFSTVLDPMLIRWSGQESLTTWYPAATNQAGSIRLSHGSKIVAVLQSRQEILVWTDSSLYALQYVGPPAVWKVELLADNISIASPNAVAIASGVVYWMGVDKFYKYDGRVQTLRCDLRQYIFETINKDEFGQVFASTNEGFNEVWWFYVPTGSTTVDLYAIHNYVESNGNGDVGVWYYGAMQRTAWLDSGLVDYPIAATYSYNLVQHENGLNDCTDSVAGVPIEAYINSSQFDIDDGQNFGFIWRLVPDITFRGSTAVTPSVTITLLPLQNSGSGYNNPTSIGGQSYAAIYGNGNQAITVGGKAYTIEQFTGQVYTRVRGRQMSFSVYSNQLDTTWQLGAPRIDIRSDGRR
jgi:hypothetical protein